MAETTQAPQAAEQPEDPRPDHAPMASSDVRSTTAETASRDGKPDKRVYALTDVGRAELESWLGEPIAEPRLKDEFLTKLILAGRPGLNGALKPLELIARQRRTYLQTLRDLNDLALRQQPERDSAALLLIEGALLHLQADLKWLDLCEQRLLTSGGVR